MHIKLWPPSSMDQQLYWLEEQAQANHIHFDAGCPAYLFASSYQQILISQPLQEWAAITVDRCITHHHNGLSHAHLPSLFNCQKYHHMYKLYYIGEHVRWNKIEYLKIFDQKKLISLFDKGFGSNLAIFLKANCSKAKINWMAHISPKAHACLT